MKILDTAALVIGAGFLIWQLENIKSVLSFGPKAPAGKVVVVSQAALPAFVTQTYADFAADPRHYGAFALNGSGQFGSTYHQNTLRAAKQEALARCAGTKAAPCKIYAVMVPKNDGDALAASMSAQAVKAFLEYRKQCGGKGAFAIADNGAYGMSWRWEDKAEAERTAMSYCKTHASESAASNPAFTKCRIVAMN